MRQFLIVLISAPVIVGLWLACSRPAVETDAKAVIAVDRSILDRIVRGRPRDSFPVINSPKLVDAESATESMSDDEIVLGLKLEDDYRAYPINFLEYHDMVMDKIGHVPILVTW